MGDRRGASVSHWWPKHWAKTPATKNERCQSQQIAIQCEQASSGDVNLESTHRQSTVVEDFCTGLS